MVQFHDGADEILNHQGHEGHEGFWLQIFPSCSLAALVANFFANCTTAEGRSGFQGQVLLVAGSAGADAAATAQLLQNAALVCQHRLLRGAHRNHIKLCFRDLIVATACGLDVRLRSNNFAQWS